MPQTFQGQPVVLVEVGLDLGAVTVEQAEQADYSPGVAPCSSSMIDMSNAADPPPSTNDV